MTLYSIQRGGTLIDAINHTALAQGSMRWAALAADADYNGHAVRVWYNDYRRYWIAEYFWAGREVLARGTFEECLRAAMQEYDRGAKFASVTVETQDEGQAAQCVEQGLECQTKENEKNPFYVDPMFKEISGAFLWEQQLHIPAVAFLANSKTVEEYQAKVQNALKERRGAS